MIETGGGSIINVSSGAADPNVTGLPPGFLTYSVAKAALERFSTGLAGEVGSLGMAVNALRPGAVKTETAIHELGEDWDWTGWTDTRRGRARGRVLGRCSAVTGSPGVSSSRRSTE